jgi:hypothetical protein
MVDTAKSGWSNGDKTATAVSINTSTLLVKYVAPIVSIGTITTATATATVAPKISHTITSGIQYKYDGDLSAVVLGSQVLNADPTQIAAVTLAAEQNKNGAAAMLTGFGAIAAAVVALSF